MDIWIKANLRFLWMIQFHIFYFNFWNLSCLLVQNMWNFLHIFSFNVVVRTFHLFLAYIFRFIYLVGTMSSTFQFLVLYLNWWTLVIPWNCKFLLIFINMSPMDLTNRTGFMLNPFTRTLSVVGYIMFCISVTTQIYSTMFF